MEEPRRNGYRYIIEPANIVPPWRILRKTDPQVGFVVREHTPFVAAKATHRDITICLQHLLTIHFCNTKVRWRHASLVQGLQICHHSRLLKQQREAARLQICYQVERS